MSERMPERMSDISNIYFQMVYVGIMWQGGDHSKKVIYSPVSKETGNQFVDKTRSLDTGNENGKLAGRMFDNSPTLTSKNGDTPYNHPHSSDFAT